MELNGFKVLILSLSLSLVFCWPVFIGGREGGTPLH